MAGPEEAGSSYTPDLLPDEQWERARQILLTLRKRRDDERLAGDELERAYETEVGRLPADLRGDDRFMRGLRNGYETNIQGYFVDLPDDEDDGEENGAEGDTSTQTYTEEALKATRGFWRTKFRERDIVDLPPQKEWNDIELAIRRARNDEQFRAINLKYDELKAQARGKLSDTGTTKVDSPKAETSSFNKPLTQMNEQEYAAYEQWLDTLSKEKRDAEIAKREQERANARSGTGVTTGETKSGGWSEDEIGNKQRELRAHRKKYDIPKGEGREKFNKLARDLKSQKDFDEATAFVETFPFRNVKKDDEQKNNEGKDEPFDKDVVQKNLRNLVDKIYDVPEADKAGFLADIDNVSTPDEMAAITDRLHKNYDRKSKADDRGKKNGKPADTGKGPGIKDTTPPKVRRVETLPDGTIRVTDVDPNTGETKTEIIGTPTNVGSGRHSNVAPDEMDTRRQNEWIHNVSDERLPAVREPEFKRPTFFERLRYVITGKAPEHPAITHALGQDSHLSDREKAIMRQTLKWERAAIGRERARDAEAGQRVGSERWNRFKSYFNGVGKAMLYTAAIAPIAAVALATLGVGGIPLASAFVGSLAASGFNRIVNNAMEKAGFKKPARVVASLLLGGLAGIEVAGAVHALGLDQWVSGFFASAPPIPTPANVPPLNHPLHHSLSYLVPSGSETAMYGLDGFLDTKVYCSKLFCNLSDCAQDQFTDAMRRTLVDNPDFANQFVTGAHGAVIRGGDLVVHAGDTIHAEIFKNPAFLESLKEHILGNPAKGILSEKKYLIPELVRAGGVDKFINALRAAAGK